MHRFEAEARAAKRAETLQKLAKDAQQQMKRLADDYQCAEDDWASAEARLAEVASDILGLPASIVQKEVEKRFRRKLEYSADVAWDEVLRQSGGEQLFTLTTHDMEKEGLPGILHDHVFPSTELPALCRNLQEREISDLLDQKLASFEADVQNERLRRLDQGSQSMADLLKPFGVADAVAPCREVMEGLELGRQLKVEALVQLLYNSH